MLLKKPAKQARLDDSADSEEDECKMTKSQRTGEGELGVPVGKAVVVLDEQGNSSWVQCADGEAVGWIKTRQLRAPAPLSPSKPHDDGRPLLPSDTDSEPEAEEIQHNEPKEDMSGGDEPKRGHKRRQAAQTSH